jgi:hypothetical protein
VHEVHLPEVGLGRIGRNPAAVLDRDAAVGVALDTEPFEQ